MNKTCDNCGTDNPPAANYCRQCGRPWADQRVRSATKVTPVLRQWRVLTHRMTRKEVRRLLGEPLRVELTETQARTAENWIYEYEVEGASEERLRGLVSFSTAEGTVVSWTEPDWARM
jgi:hypothetical protein